MSLSLKDNITDTMPERIVAPLELAEMAQAAVKEFQGCFWFRHRDAEVRFMDDVELVIRHLREYGNWKAWWRAQELRRCL